MIWIATEDGLNRFDGNRFTVYRHHDDDTNSLPGNDITCIHEDKAGRLWVGANGGFLSLYDRTRDAFIKVSSFKGGDTLSAITVRYISSDHTGMVWAGSYNGLYYIDPAAKKILALPAALEQTHQFNGPLVTSIFEDSKNQIWFGTTRNLVLYDPEKKQVYNYAHDDADPASLCDNNIKVITEDKKGRIWIGTNNGLSLALPNGHFKNFLHRDNDSRSLSNNLIYAIEPDANGQLWVGTEEGLNILDSTNENFTRILPNKWNTYSLARKSVRTIYIDPQGIYWLGTYQGGISKYDRNLNLFQLKQSNAFDDNGLSSPVVTSFAEGKNGAVYIGTDGGGVNLFNPKTGLFSHVPLACNTKTPSGSLPVLALHMDREGLLWIGTYSNGLLSYAPSAGNCRLFKQGPGSINNNDIFCITEDHNGNLWIGTNGSGVNLYDRKTGVFHVYNNRRDGSRYIPINGYIRAITEDRNGNIWIASHGTGIVMLNPVTNKTRLFDKINSNLPVNTVLTLLCDGRNNIWVGTAGGGLSLLNKKDSTFTSYSEKEGLQNANVYKILEDESGQIWVSTNAGISQFDPGSSHFTNYTRYNGVQNNNFVLGSGVRSQSGELYFGGLDGFNYFNPRSFVKNRNVPAVMLTDLRVANQSVVPSANGPLREQISIAREISLDYKQNFSLSYGAIDYTSPEQNNYSYKLEGFDKDWNYVGHGKTASYTNIDPGDYVFHVRVRNSDGVWNNKGASIVIHITPPFWRTKYAYFFYVVFFIGVFLFYRYKTLQKLRRKFEAEQEKRRVEQLMEQQKKEVEVARELDQLKIKFLTNLSHEFRTPISLIMGPVDNLLNHIHDKGPLGQLQMIRRNARRLLNLVNQLLDFRKMEENELTLHASEGEVIGFMKEVFDSFIDLSERKRIHYTFNSDIKTLFTHFDHDKLERILFNLLSNAFKFTPVNGSISMEVKRAEATSDAANTWLGIRVSDTGIGIPDEQRQKIFERFFQINSTSILNQGSGIGLSITNEFVKMQGGTIDVNSTPGTGTEFVVQLPFCNARAQEPIATPAAIEKEPVVEEPAPLNGTNGHGGDITLPAILLVEDDDDFRFYLKDNLKHYYTVIEAANGKEGWQKALANHPLLVVSDINMPMMDGIQLINKIKHDKRTSHIPVILLTALTGEEEQLKGLATGANDYMTKPFNFQILNSKIRNLLVLNHSLKTTYSKQIQVNVPQREMESPDAVLMKEIRLYIEEHLIDPRLSVDHLSKHLNMSRSSLYSKMLHLTGQTPIEYIRAIKLDKAAILLEKNNFNIAQVAYAAGFATPNYFARAFKAKFNMSPSDYANKKRKG
ncbi:hypothetical protein A3860_22515 [Niastella vici]|uniref:histidine kinase n=1 Tax=Niastella vici TaxID=1703345 RepID=A0A1V9FZD0_9BACT|nr:hypothetical protein A3860_22515 [Niastella vici]